MGSCNRIGIIVALAVALGLGGAALADDRKVPPAPQPGPELAHLKQMEGTWAATVKMGDMESQATATYRMECGGLWLVSNFKGSFGGQPFQGRGLESYDAAKKKYVSVWVDSMVTTPMILEGTYDDEKKAMIMTGEMPGPDGKMTKVKTVAEVKDPKTVVWTMYSIAKEGQEQPMMTITYSRKATVRSRPKAASVRD